MNYLYTSKSNPSVFWSGLRWGDSFLMRSVSMNKSVKNVVIQPWPDVQVSIPALPYGRTFLGKLDRKNRTVYLTDTLQKTTSKLVF